MKKKLINFKVTEEEKETIESKAKALNLSVSEFIRFLCLNINVEVSGNLNIELKNERNKE